MPLTPLEVANAMTCGSMGYMIEQSLQNAMQRKNISREVLTIPAQVVVDPEDPAFLDPSKPIGPFYTETEALSLGAEKGWRMKEDSGRGFRRYVPSPYPVDVVEKKAIRNLLEQDYILVTCGGGGIPVHYTREGLIRGVDCVIDKDLASMKIALAIGADTLIIITGVPAVAVNFNKPDQRFIPRMSMKEAEHHFDRGEFPKGSMGPKIRAAVEFVNADLRTGSS